MSYPTAHPRYCRCGTAFQHRVVDVLNKPVASGLGVADKLRLIPKVEGRWYWCPQCDRVPLQAGR